MRNQNGSPAFEFGQRVRVSLEYELKDGWRRSPDYSLVGTVVGGPEIRSDDTGVLADGVNVLPDDSPGKNDCFDSGYPRFVSEEPFWRELPDNRKVLLRFMIDSVAD